MITLACLYQEPLNLAFHLLNLTLQLAALICRNTAGNHLTRDTTGASKSDLGRDKHIRDVLIFAEEGKVQQNFKGNGISSHDDQLRYSTIKSLRALVRA